MAWIGEEKQRIFVKFETPNPKIFIIGYFDTPKVKSNETFFLTVSFGIDNLFFGNRADYKLIYLGTGQVLSSIMGGCHLALTCHIFQLFSTHFLPHLRLTYNTCQSK